MIARPKQHTGATTVMAKSLEQLRREAAKLQEQIEFREKSEQKYINMAEQVKKACTEAGFTLAELLPYLQPEKKPRAPRGTAAPKVVLSLDKEGKKPEKGVTYHHSSMPEDLVYAGTRVPNAWLELIKNKGVTWESLKVKEAKAAAKKK
jgi:hypothetical protein